MAEDNNAVKFWALIAKVQTMADGGLRVYLDLSEDAVETVAILMQYKRLGVVADVTIKPKTGNDDREAGKTSKPKL